MSYDFDGNLESLFGHGWRGMPDDLFALADP